MTRHTFSSAEEVTARVAMYRLLARFWLREVDQELVRQLGTSHMRDAFVEAGGVVPPGSDDGVIEQLAIDYCQLFVGPKDHLPPFQSVWQSGQFQGRPAESMRRYIDHIQYEADKLPRRMMLDHLGVQLDVMAHVLGQIVMGSSGTGSPKADRDLAFTYFVAHLQWPTDYLEIAAGRARTDFYRSAILLTRDFLISEVPA